MKSVRGLAALAMLLAAGHASAGFIYDEAVDGDLSNNGLMPTALVIGEGDNRVSGVSGGAFAGGDPDFLSVIVPVGLSLTAMMVEGLSDDIVFVALQGGSVFDVNVFAPAGQQALMGYGHAVTADIGTDLFPKLQSGIAPGLAPMGFATPLGPGTYTFLLAEAGAPSSYSYNFVAVPEPGAVALLSVGMLGLAFARRRRG